MNNLNNVNIPKETEEKIKALEQSVLKCFDFLFTWGYKYAGIKKNGGTAVKHAIVLILTNEPVKREINIYYWPFDIDDNVTDSVSIEIIKIPDSINDKYDFLEISEYIRRFKPTLEPMFEPQKYDGSIGMKFEHVLNHYKVIFNEIASILNGVKWQSDIRFEWGEQLEKVLYEEQKRIIYGSKKKN